MNEEFFNQSTFVDTDTTSNQIVYIGNSEAKTPSGTSVKGKKEEGMPVKIFFGRSHQY